MLWRKGAAVAAATAAAAAAAATAAATATAAAAAATAPNKRFVLKKLLAARMILYCFPIGGETEVRAVHLFEHHPLGIGQAVSLDGAADFLQVLRVRLKDSIVFVVVLYFIGGRERGSEPHAWMRATL